ncbi:M23 family metallopeptidase [Pseudomonas sp. RT6P73]
MIISPPFIPAPVAGETDEAFLARAMVGGVPGDGGYPLSFDLNWHGGMHLTAPQEGGKPLPVSAISDGAVVYFRQPTLESTAAPTHALRYREKWTDDGCIVIRHETDIGEGDKAKIIFYSIYMHLSKITLPGIQKGKVVYRKEPVGEAGNIYGEKDRIHFEIVVDDSKIENLVGRKGKDLKFQTSEGRKDSVWGDAYFFIPPEVCIYENPPQNLLSPQNNSPVVYRCPAMPTGPAPIEEAGAPVSSTTPITVQGYDWAVASELQHGIFVRMSYSKGSCKLTTFTHSGFELGAQDEKANYEYDIYKTANEYFPKCPSAGFELLRFGRVLGEEHLVPADAAHWRQIKFPGKAGEGSKSGWVDLNSLTVTKFSDADFPHWQGWQLIDDDTDSDSHCQSPFIRAFLNLDASKIVSDNTDAVGVATSPIYNSLSPDEKQKLSDRYVVERSISKDKLESKDTQERIKRFICKFPSEWCKSDFDTRYGWLLKVSENGPMPQDAYDKIKSHQQALSFWEDAALEGIENKHWHMPPREFISAFRKCSWLSRNELVQLLPMNSLRKAATWQWESVNLNSAATLLSSSTADALTRRNDLNKALRKFLVVTPVRLACFFGNATQETQWYQKFQEGSPYWYKPWDGRGFLQLTHASNYIKYWEFKGDIVSPQVKQVLATHTTMANNNRPMIAGHKSMYDPTNSLSDASTGIPQAVIAKRDAVKNSYDAANSAGAYWAWSGASKQADGYYTSSSSTLKTLTTNAQTKHYYENSAFGNVAATVNLGSPSSSFSSIWGVQARFLAFANAQVVLLDGLSFPTSTGVSSNTPQDFVRRRVE